MISNLINIYKLCSKNNIKYTFYSESSHYQKYFYSYIFILNQKRKDIFYVSSDKKDVINLENVKNIYVGNGLIRFFLFLFIKTELFFLTVTDLNYNILKKNRFVKKYIYVFHAAVSTHKSYTETAFNDYDIILSVGNHHNNEILKTEKLFKLKKKQLVNSGYFYFDFLLENAKLDKVDNYILVAPSWNKSKDNFLINECEILIEFLLIKNFKLIFRPHPEHYKRDKLTLNKIQNKFKEFPNFIFDKKKDNLDSLEKSLCLITDNSGIAIEYTFIFKRLVIYFDKFSKIHNNDFKSINTETFENKIKNEFGFKCDLNNLNALEKKLKDTQKLSLNKNDKIEKFIKSDFFNFGKSSEYVYKYFENDI